MTVKDEAGEISESTAAGDGRDVAGARLAAKLFNLGSASNGDWEPGGLLGAAVKDWRNTNLFDELVEAAEILRDRGVDIDAVRDLPVGDSYRLFENGSKVDDPKLKSMWAGLLANALDPARAVSPRPLLVDTLNRLGALEAGMLEFIYGIKSIEQELTAEARALATVTAEFQGFHRLQRQFGERVAAGYTQVIVRYSNIAIKHAISLLVREDLIAVNVEKPSFSSSVSFPSQNTQIDAHALVKTLRQMIERTDYLQGKSDSRILPLLKDGMLYYHLTSFGSELMDGCH